MNSIHAPPLRVRRIPQRLRRFLLVLFIPVLMAGCASPPDRAPPSEYTHTSLERLATQHRVCGVALAIIKNRKLHSIDSTSGCEPPHAVGSDSVFQAASLSKPVFAYAVLKLVGLGKLELDAPVIKYLPHGYRHAFNPLEAEASSKSDWVTDPRIHKVTVRMVLNHTSGLPNWASGPLHFESAPGERWEYSGEGYVLLQRAVEAVTGQPLDQFMRTEVFVPLHMDHSDYTSSTRIASRLLPGTKANGAPRTTLELMNPVAAFSLYTTAEDYGTFLVAVLNDEGLLRKIAASPVVVDPSLNLSWGLGWGIERTRDDVLLWHWGNNTGYRAFVIVSVRTGDGLVMLTNGEGGLKLAEPLTGGVLPGAHELFQSPMLGGGITDFLCETLRLCF